MQQTLHRKDHSMTTRKLEAGSPIDSHCQKCKELTSHTVIAMDGERVLKVQCKLCGGRHALRGAPKPASPGRSKKAVVPSKKQDTVAKEWDKQVGSADPAGAHAYGMDKCFGKGDLIEHPQFGLGVVQSLQRPDKMEVLFQQGLKLMRCSLK
jgi:hypothetical protein